VGTNDPVGVLEANEWLDMTYRIELAVIEEDQGRRESRDDYL